MMASLGLENVNWDLIDADYVPTDEELEANRREMEESEFELPMQSSDASLAPVERQDSAQPVATNAALQSETFSATWEEPALHLLSTERPEPPSLPLNEVLPPFLVQWVSDSAKSKGAPVDYVFGGLLAAAASLIGTTRWASPKSGWKEPAILWLMLVGNPSAGKSPALDAAITPMQEIQGKLVAEYSKIAKEHETLRKIAKQSEAVWNSQVKQSIADGKDPPPQPATMDLPKAPVRPRLVINDATVEKTALILEGQERGVLLFRDEAASWLLAMARYNADSDRGFWLECYGGRSFTVERISRAATYVKYMSVCVVGGIQPDRLRSVLLEGDDDGLTARFIPIWPEPAPIQDDDVLASSQLFREMLELLHGLQFDSTDEVNLKPVILPFTPEARAVHTDFRRRMRDLEEESDGLLLSFLGKMSGLAVRLSLVLTYLEWAGAMGRDKEPVEISADGVRKAILLVESYIIPMARRAYAEASVPVEVLKCRRLVAALKERDWEVFSSKDLLRIGMSGMTSAAELNPILTMLEDGEIIKRIETPPKPSGGRPAKQYAANPVVFT